MTSAMLKKSAKSKQSKAEALVFNEKELYNELLHSAKAVGLSLGAAEVIATKVVKKVAEHLARRAVITTDDLNRFIADETEKYSKDLAYVYKNRGKII